MAWSTSERDRSEAPSLREISIFPPAVARFGRGSFCWHKLACRLTVSQMIEPRRICALCRAAVNKFHPRKLILLGRKQVKPVEGGFEAACELA